MNLFYNFATYNRCIFIISQPQGLNAQELMHHAGIKRRDLVKPLELSQLEIWGREKTSAHSLLYKFVMLGINEGIEKIRIMQLVSE